MKCKTVFLILLLLALAACGRKQSDETEPVTVPETVAQETASIDQWKQALSEELFQKYGVLPEYYEPLGDGTYQVYVEVGGEILPFGTVDAETGAYHQ